MVRCLCRIAGSGHAVSDVSGRHRRTPLRRHRRRRVHAYPGPARVATIRLDVACLEALQRAHDVVGASAVWFNDFDYHGVFAAPFFRYSIRVDGVFTDAFRRLIEERYR